jgi:hypothetical protein
VDSYIPTPDDLFEHLLITLKDQKPNDRSNADRYWAIVITEVEKARAIYLTYAAPKEGAE